MNILISLIVFSVSVFLMAVSIRYGLIAAYRMDNYFSTKNNSNYPGFQWFYRIPFGIGAIPEYFYAMLLGHDNYFTRSWWPLKTSSFISILLFIAMLKSRSAVFAYFSLDIIRESGFIGLFTSGNFIMFLNIIVILYAALFVILSIESIKMHGIYSVLRIGYYSILCLLMANFTIITLSIIVFITIAYIVIKVIWFFLSSSKRRKRADDEEEETAGGILSDGFSDFKSDLYDWENSDQKEVVEKKFERDTSSKPRRRPKVTRRKKKTVKREDEIPRIRPDK